MQDFLASHPNALEPSPGPEPEPSGMRAVAACTPAKTRARGWCGALHTLQKPCIDDISFSTHAFAIPQGRAAEYVSSALKWCINDLFS